MEIQQALLTPNKYSRPQSPLKDVKAIVIHWVANPNSTALQNRNFFENRKYGKTNYGSAHYIVGLQGEILQCVPDNEVAYHVGSKTYPAEAIAKLGAYPNATTLGIEATHIDWNGKMTDETYKSLVELTVFLLKKYNLTEKDLWLHKEVVGWKSCHKWFVDNPGEWTKFKNIIQEKLVPQIYKGDDDKLKLEGYQWDMLEKTLHNLYKKGILNSLEWSEKAKKKELTVSQLAWLNTIIMDRNIK